MRAVILFAHGSRDPAWQAPLIEIQSLIEAHIKKQSEAKALASNTPHVAKMAVARAFLELCEPSLPEVIEQLATQGVTQIDIVPAFLARGKHLVHDLPELVNAAQQGYPHIQFIVHSAWGEMPDVQTALARATFNLLQINQ